MLFYIILYYLILSDIILYHHILSCIIIFLTYIILYDPTESYGIPYYPLEFHRNWERVSFGGCIFLKAKAVIVNAD